MSGMTAQRMRVVRGIPLSFLHRHAGPTAVLLIHGNSSGKEVFDRQWPALCRTPLSVVVPDLPGHGQSHNAPFPARTYSFTGYARILAELMGSLGYRSYHVMGWSLGGHIGLEMLGAVSAVRSLLITGTPPIRLTDTGVAAGFRWTATTALAGRRLMLPEQIARYAAAMMGGPTRRMREFHSLVERTDGDARFWMVHNGMNGVGLDEVEVIRNVERPLAIVQGRSDPFLKIDYIRSLDYRNIWGGQPILLDGGHAVHWTNPSEFNCQLIRFLLD